MDFGGLWGNYVQILNPMSAEWTTPANVYRHLIRSSRACIHLLDKAKKQWFISYLTIYADHPLLLVPISLEPHFRSRHVQEAAREHLRCSQVICRSPRLRGWTMVRQNVWISSTQEIDSCKVNMQLVAATPGSIAISNTTWVQWESTLDVYNSLFYSFAAQNGPTHHSKQEMLPRISYCPCQTSTP